jgi:hypothetical protein
MGLGFDQALSGLAQFRARVDLVFRFAGIMGIFSCADTVSTDEFSVLLAAL